MLRLLVTLFISIAILGANDDVEVYSLEMDANATHIHAQKSVLIIYKKHHMRASRALYDKSSGEIEMFGDIYASQGEDFVALGEYARMNIAQKSRTFKPFYMLDKSTKMWVSTKLASAEDRDFELSSGVMSSCDPTDPLWSMKFSSSDYNQDDKWLNIYNVRLNFYDIPIFYTPYFGFSLDTTRRSGLLYPSFGISANEGFFYQQPIYVAEEDNWDLELNPQVRTKRGYGMYGTLRFVESQTAKGEITTGFFQEKQSYKDEYDLANTTHQGITIDYQNSDFLKEWFGVELEGYNGLGVDLNLMNDVDYINLSKNDALNTITASQTLSRINMFYGNDEHYVGTYFKYYTDLSEKSNANTIQNLPTLQYHNYLDTFLDDHLLYSVDVQFNNFERASGIKAQQSDISIPISLQDSFFDDYLNLSYTANLYAKHLGFHGTPNKTQQNTDFSAGNFARNYNTFNANVKVSKGFEDFSHTMMFDTTYVNGGGNYKSGYFDANYDHCKDNIASDNGCEYYGIYDIEEKAKFEFSQYLHDEKGSQLLYHKLSQSVSYQSDTINKIRELENELEVMISDSISLYNDIFYNHQDNIISKSISSINYNDEDFVFGLNHYFERSDTTRADFIGSSLKYIYNSHYSYNAQFDYNIHTKQKKRLALGFRYSKRCWEFGVEYVENNRPILTNNQVQSLYDKYVYFTIVLKPLGGVDNLSYEIDSR
jgi:LPS-assembly protein